MPPKNARKIPLPLRAPRNKNNLDFQLADKDLPGIALAPGPSFAVEFGVPFTLTAEVKLRDSVPGCLTESENQFGDILRMSRLVNFSFAELTVQGEQQPNN